MKTSEKAYLIGALIGIAAVTSFIYLSPLEVYLPKEATTTEVKPEYRQENYTLYYKDGSTINLFDAQTDGICGNIIILPKKWGTWQHVKGNTYDSIIKIK